MPENRSTLSHRTKIVSTTDHGRINASSSGLSLVFSVPTDEFRSRTNGSVGDQVAPQTSQLALVRMSATAVW
jgi:hypothetical protein